MRRAILLAPALLGACATSLTELPPGRPGGRCTGDNAKALIGRRYSQSIRDQAKYITSAPIIRVVRPGEMMTMDYRSDRLTIRLDARDRIVGASCG